MAIPNPQGARYNSLQEFVGFFKKADQHPSFTNLYSVHFATPPILSFEKNFQSEKGTLSFLLDYYAKTVNLPSKQLTTGQVQTAGAPYKYVTGNAFSQVSMTFTVPRSQQTRTYFERWTHLISSDSNQYTDFYVNYCSPRVMIYKWERGGGDYAIGDPKLLRAIRENGTNALLARKNKLTAVWELRNLFPYNIGSVQLDNSASKTMDLEIQFYYERYRFFGEDKFDETPLVASTTPSSGGSSTDTETSRNQTRIPERNTTVRDPREIARNRGT